MRNKRLIHPVVAALSVGLGTWLAHAQGSDQADRLPSSTSTLMGPQLPSGQSISQTSPLSAAQAEKKFSFDLKVGSNSDFRNSNDPDHSAKMTYSLWPTLQLSPEWSVLAKLDLDQNLTGLREWKMRDSSLKLSHSPIAVAGAVDIVPYASAVAPTSYESRHDRGMIAGGGIGNRFEYAGVRDGAPNLILKDSVSGAYYHYQYETSTSGASNNPFRLTNTLEAGYQITPPLSLTASFVSYGLWSYHGSPSSKFDLSQEAAYELSKNWSVNLGHSNMADYFKDNGIDSNFALYNGNSSIFYGTLIFSY